MNLTDKAIGVMAEQAEEFLRLRAEVKRLAAAEAARDSALRTAEMATHLLFTMNDNLGAGRAAADSLQAELKRLWADYQTVTAERDAEHKRYAECRGWLRDIAHYLGSPDDEDVVKFFMEYRAEFNDNLTALDTAIAALRAGDAGGE